ncbi:serine/threonine protein kinase [Archangium minus]|uniref:Serine/threonine protein kinase n=1 Tax=Archangium minus TaxID=83450 RepID=A0ABY9X9N4_9BACT|nr:serine/threonine protein kinase [Archangium minus]
MSVKKPLALPVVILLPVIAGCTSAGVALRPDGSPGPEKCSEKALEVMRILRMHVGDAADAHLDANQIDASPVIVYDGPLESYLTESLGTLEPGTRLYGQVWTGGFQVVVRYYEAHPTDGDKVPICAVARLGRGQMRKKPESMPGSALLEHGAVSVFVVESFR